MLGPRYSCDWSTLLQMLVDGGQDKIDIFLLCYTFQITVYSVWRERNGRRHGEKPQTGDSQRRYIDKYVRNRISTTQMVGGKG
ncbi:BnaC08g48690D [Brassica napus]|uniref:Uncharacterized protein n=2 Tax=Brassica TaxID=3705 RepID=A0A3P6FV28_BRAOL|nr:unnamed protein product [Brassica napus]CDY57362.1 BnaC08g48690D [Brassica napus]VDD56898.1 unnamed protein product [Brassica oleracea]